MSGTKTSENEPATNRTISSQASASARSDDPAWAHGIMVEGKKNQVICVYCDRLVSGGGITRLKEHLGHITGDIAACKKVPSEVKWQMKRLVLENRKAKARNKQLSSDIGNPVLGTIGEDGGEEVESQDHSAEIPELISLLGAQGKGKEKVQYLSSGSGQRKRRKTLQSPCTQQSPVVTDYFQHRTAFRSQTSINCALLSKEKKDTTDLALARWWFDANIPFNASRSKYYQPMVDAIASFGPGYKAPSYHDIRGKLLRSLVQEVNLLINHFRNQWVETGCTIISDVWTNSVKNRTLMNFLVYSPEGIVFVKSVDASGITKDVDALFKLFDEVVMYVGAPNVVQFITDNEASYKAATRKLVSKHNTFFATSSAAHTIDLILEDMAKAQLFPSNSITIDQAKKITKFIYNHSWVLNLMRRDFTNGRDLIRPTSTTFATHFLTLQCLYKYQKELRQMFTSNSWKDSSYSRTLAASEVCDIVLDSNFWKNVEHLMKASESLIMVHHLVASDSKPTMGFLYEAMDRAKEVIKRRLKKKTDYIPYWNLIDDQWRKQLDSPLYVVAYMLNPMYYFLTSFNKHREANSALTSVVVQLVPDEDTQDKILLQVDQYKSSIGEFGTNIAIRNRCKMAPEKWWDHFGNSTLDLQRLAKRILSQCCSSCGCERNWSIFEHIHTEKRNRLEYQRLIDMVFVHYNMKLHEKQAKNRHVASIDPISLENINLLEEWIVEDPILLDDDVCGWHTVEQPNPIEGDVNLEDELDVGDSISVKEAKVGNE